MTAPIETPPADEQVEPPLVEWRKITCEERAIARSARPDQSDEEIRQWCGALITDSAVLSRAYRLAAHKLHPDTGGEPGEFERLQQARAVLNGGAS